ncbi:MAG TPA: response regulator transcription factor [Streptosporangiaceae bacterium]
MTGVLIVEVQRTLATALEIAIEAQPDLQCVGAVGTVQDAIDRIRRIVPDVVLMDLDLPGADGIEGTRQIKASCPDVNVLILSAGADPHRVAAAAAAGAAGVITTDTSFAEILELIRNPVDGATVEGITLKEQLEKAARQGQAAAVPGPRGPAGANGPGGFGESGGGAPHPGDPTAESGPESDWARLTVREREVLSLMGEGLDPSAIAIHLTISLHTARGHVKNIMMKLGAHSQLEAVVMAARSGLIRPVAPPHPHDLYGPPMH